MPIDQAIDWAGIENELYSWATDTTGMPWIWANQDAPQPAYPYGVINRIAGPAQVGQDETRWDPSTATFTLTGLRQFTISMMLNVEPGSSPNANTEAIGIMSTLLGSLRGPTVQAAFRSAGVSVKNSPAIQNLSLAIGGQWLRRAQMDVVFGTASNIDETGFGWFNSVVVSSGDIVGASSAIDIVDETFGV